MSITIPRRTRLGVKVRKRNSSKYRITNALKRHNGNTTNEPHMIDSEYNKAFVKSMFAVRGKIAVSAT